MKYLILVFTTLFLFGCNKDDSDNLIGEQTVNENWQLIYSNNDCLITYSPVIENERLNLSDSKFAKVTFDYETNDDSCTHGIMVFDNWLLNPNFTLSYGLTDSGCGAFSQISDTIPENFCDDSYFGIFLTFHKPGKYLRIKNLRIFKLLD